MINQLEKSCSRKQIDLLVYACSNHELRTKLLGNLTPVLHPIILHP